ncbi:MAG: Rieske 2Fe-2S domain-containing protein [Phormidesmis sp.]
MSSQRETVCQVNDLEVGHMQQFFVAGKEILLIRSESGFSAIAPHCSHYGAPLAKGILHAGRIVAPGTTLATMPNQVSKSSPPDAIT